MDRVINHQILFSTCRYCCVPSKLWCIERWEVPKRKILVITDPLDAPDPLKRLLVKRTKYSVMAVLSIEDW